MIKLSRWDSKALEEFARSGARTKSPFEKIAMPLRILLTGTKVSPGIFEVIELLGREETKKARPLGNFGLIKRERGVSTS